MTELFYSLSKKKLKLAMVEFSFFQYLFHMFQIRVNIITATNSAIHQKVNSTIAVQAML